MSFIELDKAFGKVKRADILWKTLNNRGTFETTIRGTQSLYKKTKNYVRTLQKISETFDATQRK